MAVDNCIVDLVVLTLSTLQLGISLHTW